MTRDRDLLQLFADCLRQRFPGARVWMFGSRAWGTPHEYSDLDVCVVLDEVTPAIRTEVSDLAWEVGFRNDTLIATTVFSQEMFEQGPAAASPFVRRIRREGVVA